MRKVTLFIAMSLDGYIADCQGHVDWLAGQEPGEDDMQTYHEFIKTIDTVIMGWNTYHQIRTELSPDAWYYSTLQSYVITHREQAATENIIFTSQNVGDLITSLQAEQGKGIWICGGAQIAQQLIEQNMIQCYHISIIPILLGDGIRLFKAMEQDIKLQLIKSESYHGITDLIYEQRCTK